MTHDPYGQPDDRPSLRKQPDASSSSAGEPAGLGDPSQQAGWGEENQPYSNQPYATQPYGSQPYGSQPYSTQPYGTPPGASQPWGVQSANPYPGQPYGAKPPPYGSPPPYAPMYSPYAQPSQSNGLAVAALVTGICGFICCLPGLAAIGLGIAGLNESKRTGVGRGMSIAGISLGSVWIALGVGWLIVVTATRA